MATRYDQRRKAEHDKGEFRLTLVMQNGEAQTKKHTSWKRAYTLYSSAEKDQRFVFGILRQGEGENSGDIKHPVQSFSNKVYDAPI